MRILVLSDIHANLPALQAVLRAAAPFDAVWCLGDLVGYGPDANEVVETVRSLPNFVSVLGNHDAAVLGLIELAAFNREARTAIVWTQSVLKPENHRFLETLQERVVLDGVTLVHGSPRSPVWEYLLDWQSAAENFSYFDTPLCFVGHTHIPIAYYWGGEGEQVEYRLLGPDDGPLNNEKQIVNPGSVGQPRNRDPRAAYAIYWPEQHTWRTARVEYDMTQVQARILAANLPDRHAHRLSGGW